ncbi:MAG: hypothetical protein C0597_06690 [Marinilabiliales bacterium]|nr:MAG: hypothetical protein C0597_06690 [Marinilabiliales bacterium]
MKKLGVCIISILVFLGCEQAEDNSEIPTIEFLSFNVIPGDGESTIAEGIISFSFVDGDGNIGFLENTDANNDGNDTNNMVDFVYTEYHKQNGVFVEKSGDPYYLPYFEKGIYRKSLKGTIDIYLPRTILSPDTVYYEFYILDRDLNQSNIEITPEIIYSELIEQL